jgi:transcriptional regulator with XRE-family HTH domain
VPTPFGKQLAAWRRDAGKLQADVAAAVGVGQQAVSTWENDGWPSPPMVLPLARFLGVDEAEMAVLYLRLREQEQTEDEATAEVVGQRATGLEDRLEAMTRQFTTQRAAVDQLAALVDQVVRELGQALRRLDRLDPPGG